MSYFQLKEEAIRLKAELSLLSYFFILERKNIFMFDGKRGKEYFFRFEHQKTGSISVNDQKNIWFDHSNEDGGDIIKAVQKFENKTFIDAIKYLSTEKICSIGVNNAHIGNLSNPITYELDSVTGSVKHPALLKYTHNRGLDASILNGFIKEVHWRYGNKRYFGIGLGNINGGYAVRNQFFKGNIGRSGISVLSIGETPKSVKLFEGLMDFLSFRTLQKEENFIGIVLNSTANLTIHTIEHITNMANNLVVQLYLDNDNTGRNATKKILDVIPNAQDKSCFYVTKNGSDINDFLMEQRDKTNVFGEK